MAIICVFILIILIVWLIRGGRFELGINNNGKNSDSDIDIDLQIKSDDSLKVVLVKIMVAVLLFNHGIGIIL